jgi:hypothetical protein
MYSGVCGGGVKAKSIQLDKTRNRIHSEGSGPLSKRVCQTQLELRLFFLIDIYILIVIASASILYTAST